MAIDKKLIDQLLSDYKNPEDIIGENGLLKELTKAVLERALQAEMTEHLGYEKHDPAGHHRGNTRNGKSQKSLQGEFGELELETPRDRQATFEPKIVTARSCESTRICCVIPLPSRSSMPARRWKTFRCCWRTTASRSPSATI